MKPMIINRRFFPVQYWLLIQLMIITATTLQARSENAKPADAGFAAASNFFGLLNHKPDTGLYNLQHAATVNKSGYSPERKKTEAIIHNNHFIRAYTDKTSCFTGEPILLTYKLYSVFTSTSKITKQPSLNNFTVHDLQDHIALHEETETIGGKVFKVHTLRKIQLVPLQAGMLDINPIELESTIRYTFSSLSTKSPASGLRSIFDHYLKEEKRPAEYLTMKFTGQKMTILARPLPEAGRPVNFEGAVGDFNISMQVLSENIVSNTVALLRVEINGNGNFPFIDAPVIKWPENITNPDIHVYGGDFDSADGKKVFEYRFIAASEGKYTIPPVSFSFFDVSHRAYKTIQTLPVSFEVKADKKRTIAIVQNKNRQEQAPVKTTLLEKYYPLATATLLILACISILYHFRSFKTVAGSAHGSAQSSHEKHEAFALSPEPAPDPLFEARKLMEHGQFNEFQQELRNVLFSELSTKIQLPQSQINKSNIAGILSAKGWNEEMIVMLRVVLTECEQTLYIPGYQTSVAPQVLLKMADTVLAALQHL